MRKALVPNTDVILLDVKRMSSNESRKLPRAEFVRARSEWLY